MPRRRKKLTKEQRKFLRTRLGPAIGKVTLALAFGLPPLIQKGVADGPGDTVTVDPFTFVGLAFAAIGAGMDIRQGVLDGDDPEVVFNEVIKTIREPLNEVLAGLGANVGPVVQSIVEAVGEAFKKHGLWDVLEDAEDLFGKAA